MAVRVGRWFGVSGQSLRAEAVGRIGSQVCSCIMAAGVSGFLWCLRF